jgi:hypothetical protein
MRKQRKRQAIVTPGVNNLRDINKNISGTTIKYNDLIHNSGYPARYGVSINITEDHWKNLETLIDMIFSKININVNILFGMTNTKLNEKVNLNLSNYHLTGKAIDFTIDNTMNDDLKYLFVEMFNELDFTELFYIEGGKYDYIHVAYDKNSIKKYAAFRKLNQKNLTTITDIDIFYNEFNIYKPTPVIEQPPIAETEEE